MRKETQCVHAGKSSSHKVRGVTTPIVTSTSFVFPNDDDEVVYPRYFNIPTQEVVAEKIARLENGERGLVFSSGMAAITSTLLGLLQQGDHAVIHSGSYGGTISFATNKLGRYGIEHTIVRGCEAGAFQEAIRSDTKLLFFETPTNPLLQIIDIAEIAELARQHGVLTIVDNTFATPVNQNPLDLGMDVVIHSGTKYLNGHSDVNCGAVVTSESHMAPILDSAVHLGGTLDVRACYLLERGLKTLALRVRQQCENARRLAEFLRGHDRVRKVFYPGFSEHPGHEAASRQMTDFGGMISIELDTDEAPNRQSAKAMVRQLKIATPAVSLGGVETLVCFPKDTSHAKLTDAQRREEGISDTLLRISVGIEDVNDLMEDFAQALDAAAEQ